MIGDEWYERPDPAEVGYEVGSRVGRSYFGFHAEGARRQVSESGVAVVNLQPGNGTAYRLVVARVASAEGREIMAGIGCHQPLAVVWAETGHGHVFQGGDLGILHEDYVAEKMRCPLADAWVIGRFLTALRSDLPPLA